MNVDSVTGGQARRCALELAHDLTFECSELLTAANNRRRNVVIRVPAGTYFAPIDAFCGADRESVYALGVMPNECERSVNVFFGDGIMASAVPRIDVPEARTIVRHYYRARHTLHFDEWRNVAEHHFEGATSSHTYEVVLRNDYAPEDHRSMDPAPASSTEPQHHDTQMLVRSTAKLRLMRERIKLGDDGARLRLTISASIEVPYMEPVLDPASLRLHGSKTLRIMFWSIKFLDSYVFRLAIRRKLGPADQCDSTCNIECEDEISGAHFMELYNLVYRYLAHSLATHAGTIRMHRDDLATSMRNLPDLNEFQRAAAATVRLLSPREDDAAEATHESAREDDDDAAETEDESADGHYSAVRREHWEIDGRSRLRRNFEAVQRAVQSQISTDRLLVRAAVLVRRLGAKSFRSFQGPDETPKFRYLEIVDPHLLLAPPPAAPLAAGVPAAYDTDDESAID